jgi:hypothetical protein
LWDNAIPYPKWSFQMKTTAIALAAVILASTPVAWAVDPGINQPGMMGNHGAGRAAVRDPGINQPGVTGNAPLARGAMRTPGVQYPRGAAAVTPRMGVDPGVNQPGRMGNIRR